MSLQQTSLKFKATSTVETQASTKVTFKEPARTVVTDTLHDHLRQASTTMVQPLQGYGRGESQLSTQSNQRVMPSSRPNQHNAKSPTYQNKGKAEVEPDVTPPCPQVKTSEVQHQLIRGTKASSLTSTRGSQDKKFTNQRQGKVYQPKYPSPKTQQRRQSQQVLVPKHMLEARRLCKGDEHKWVEHQAITRMESSGWISSQRSLEAQGYNQGNRELWLPKPEFTAYKVSSMTHHTTNKAQKSPTHRQQPKQKKQRSKPRRKPPTTKYMHLSSTSQDSLPLCGDCHSRRTQNKTTKRRTTTQQVWVPKKLLLAQGYDHGNKHLWIPKRPVKENLISVSYPQTKSLSNIGHQLESTKIGAMLECQTGLVQPSSATVVKVNLSSPPVDPCLLIKLAPTLVQIPKQIFIPKAHQYSIWDRANLLQALLFGKASLSHSAIPSWHINPTNQSRAS